MRFAQIVMGPAGTGKVSVKDKIKLICNDNQVFYKDNLLIFYNIFYRVHIVVI